MRFLRCILLLVPLFLNAFGDDKFGKEILKEFDIKPTRANLNLVKDISLNIDEIDKRSFKDIITKNFHLASMIKNELENINAPEFLLFLAMTESKLSNSATSQVQAGGIWQFMPSTAKVFGLKIDRYVDERRDPFASTDAAFRYINFLQKSFDDKWYLSLMAYNCGEGCMRRAIRSVGDDFSTLLNSATIPRETKGFIKKIIKLSIISKDDNIKNIIKTSKDSIKLSRISVKPGTKLSTIGKSIGLDEEVMKEYNAHIKQNIAPKYEQNYYFYIPTNKLGIYSVNIFSEQISKALKKYDDFKVNVAKQGESLPKITSLWRVDLNEIAKKNNLKIDDLKIDKELENPDKDTKKHSNLEYKVKNGDNLAKISNKFNVTINQILTANNLKDTKILAGDTIVIP